MPRRMRHDGHGARDGKQPDDGDDDDEHDEHAARSSKACLMHEFLAARQKMMQQGGSDKQMNPMAMMGMGLLTSSIGPECLRYGRHGEPNARGA